MSNERTIRVTVTYLPSEGIYAADADSPFAASGYTVAVEDGCAVNTIKGLTWDEMHGYMLSIFPAPRRPLFGGRVRLNEAPAASPDPGAFVEGGRNDH